MTGQRRIRFWRYNLVLEALTFGAGALVLCLALELTMDGIEDTYLQRQAADAAQAGSFLENHLNAARSSLINYARLVPDDRSADYSVLLTAYSDLYRLDPQLRVAEVAKAVPQSQVFPGFSFTLGRLRDYLGIPGQPDGLSEMMRGYEDSRTSVYFAAGPREQRVLGRLDLGYVQEFLTQFERFTGTPTLLVTEDGFVMLSSNASLTLPAVSISDWAEAPSMDRTLQIGDQSWVPIFSDPLEIGARVVSLISTAPIQSQRQALQLFLVGALLGIIALLILKNLGVRRLFIDPLTVFAERIRELEHGQLSADGPPLPPSRFRELADIQDRFSAMVTAIRQREQELEAISEQAQAASRAKSVFLANMSHEIRTPLNVALGLTQLLQREPMPASTKDLVERIQQASESLLSILNDVLDLSKIEADEITIDRRPFALNAVMNKIRILYRSQAEAKGLSLTVASTPEGTPILLGDPLRLEQILSNLVSNAIKFTDRGAVDVRVSAKAGTGAVAVCLEVEDSGIGIAEQHLGELFLPFSQLDPSSTRRYGGTGLGLSISRRLAELMGGHIDVTSRPGEGSVFQVALPFAVAPRQGAPDRHNPPVTAITPKRLDSLAVLVVDDSPSNRFLLEQTLQREGARVTCASDGEQALALLRAAPTRFAAVLMDIQMPVMDGVTAMRCIREELQLKTLPLVAVTAGTLESQAQTARDAGADELLIKPIDLEAMIQCLLRLTEGSGNSEAEASPAPTSGNAGEGAPPDMTTDPGFSPLDSGVVAAWGERDPDLYNALIEIFHEEHAGFVHRLVRLLEAGDRGSAGRLLHTLTGAAAQIGANAVRDQARALEQQLRSEGTPDTAALTDLEQALAQIPSARALRPAAVKSVETPAGPDGSNRARLLLVDDDRLATQLLASVLDDQGELWCAASGAEALEILETQRMDLVLLDAIMPGMSGLETCHLIHQRYPGTPIIFVTGASDLNSEVAALDAGAVDYISKPINPGVVHARVSVQLRLNAQARAIEDAHQRLLESATERSRLAERQRMLQDVHDGFGSQLATARLQLASGAIDQQRIDELLRECLDDLRLVIDTFDQADNRLDEALANYRFRLSQRLDGHGPSVDWRVDVRDAPDFEPRTVLQTLRILQESVNNALKHAHPTVIRIQVTHDAERGLELDISDDGQGLPERLSPGRGLNNMRDRARGIGGDLVVSSSPSGTRVNFRLLPGGLPAETITRQAGGR